MNYFFDSLVSAVYLAISLDPELLEIVGVSLRVSGVSTLLASLIGVPLGFFIAFESFRLKRLVITLFNTALSVPTVAIGLFVYILISRRGVLGFLDMLYTQKAMIIGQTLLIIPIITTLAISAFGQIDARYRQTAMTLGANRKQTALILISEARFGILAAIIAAFGRVISEIGISMMLGGNAKGFTRNITTAMALEYDKGEFILAIALGIVLLTLSFSINLLFHFFQGKGLK